MHSIGKKVLERKGVITDSSCALEGNLLRQKINGHYQGEP